jgi:hypothetical protein
VPKKKLFIKLTAGRKTVPVDKSGNIAAPLETHDSEDTESDQAEDVQKQTKEPTIEDKGWFGPDRVRPKESVFVGKYKYRADKKNDKRPVMTDEKRGEVFLKTAPEKKCDDCVEILSDDSNENVSKWSKYLDTGGKRRSGGSNRLSGKAKNCVDQAVSAHRGVNAIKTCVSSSLSLEQTKLESVLLPTSFRLVKHKFVFVFDKPF